MEKRSFRRIPVRFLVIVGIVALGFAGCSDVSNEAPLSPQQQQEMMVLGKDNPGMKRAMEVQDRFTAAFMADDDVIGTGTGLTEDGTPAVIIFKDRGISEGLPSVIEGVPVEQRVVGKITAYQFLPQAGKGNGGGKPGGGNSGPDPKSRFTRPIPIGVSAGNEGECASGTIGCRVTDGQYVYALSNNHVFARQNAASIGEFMVQPGRLRS